MLNPILSQHWHRTMMAIWRFLKGGQTEGGGFHTPAKGTIAAKITTLKTLTSLNKEVRPFFLSDDSIWGLPSVSSLSDYSIWRSWGLF